MTKHELRIGNPGASDDVPIPTFSAIYDIAKYDGMMKINFYIDIHDGVGVRCGGAAPAIWTQH